VIDGVVLALVVAVTENVDIYAAVTGAPVKDTVGAVEFTICVSAAEELPQRCRRRCKRRLWNGIQPPARNR